MPLTLKKEKEEDNQKDRRGETKPEDILSTKTEAKTSKIVDLEAENQSLKNRNEQLKVERTFGIVWEEQKVRPEFVLLPQSKLEV